MEKLEKNQNYTNQTFEDIKYTDENGIEFWYARELMKILEYKQWRRFENVINKAKLACKNSNIKVDDHFANVGKMVDIGSNTKRETNDYKLSRYACYLIAQNGDPYGIFNNEPTLKNRDTVKTFIKLPDDYEELAGDGND